MSDQFTKLREALSKTPRIKWSASKNNFTIPETEDFAGKTVGITGLDKQYARHLARYIAESSPATAAALLSEIDRLRNAMDTIAMGNTDPERMVEIAAEALKGEPK